MTNKLRAYADNLIRLPAKDAREEQCARPIYHYESKFKSGAQDAPKFFQSRAQSRSLFLLGDYIEEQDDIT